MDVKPTKIIRVKKVGGGKVMKGTGFFGKVCFTSCMKIVVLVLMFYAQSIYAQPPNQNRSGQGSAESRHADAQVYQRGLSEWSQLQTLHTNPQSGVRITGYAVSENTRPDNQTGLILDKPSIIRYTDNHQQATLEVKKPEFANSNERGPHTYQRQADGKIALPEGFKASVIFTVRGQERISAPFPMSRIGMNSILNGTGVTITSSKPDQQY